MEKRLEKATLGGGCFWCLEAVYENVKGVTDVASGYAGGHTDHPDYRSVCSGATGHAEVVQITYDPEVVSYEDLLDIFWTIHDPTTLNRQGADVGTQYRSVIFYHDDAQKKIAEVSKEKAQARYRDPIVTEIAPLSKFWPAEEYHQDYFRKNPHQGYCQAVVAPKVEKFKTHHKGWVK
ncbi:peptide-methionine (S)-S-oxide reductase MsrA [Hydrogenimonas sp.]